MMCKGVGETIIECSFLLKYSFSKIVISESLCCTAEIGTTLNQLYLTFYKKGENIKIILFVQSVDIAKQEKNAMIKLKVYKFMSLCELTEECLIFAGSKMVK